jgi:hypothetical protein
MHAAAQHQAGQRGQQRLRQNVTADDATDVSGDVNGDKMQGAEICALPKCGVVLRMAGLCNEARAAAGRGSVRGTPGWSACAWRPQQHIAAGHEGHQATCITIAAPPVHGAPDAGDSIKPPFLCNCKTGHVCMTERYTWRKHRHLSSTSKNDPHAIAPETRTACHLGALGPQGRTC